VSSFPRAAICLVALIAMSCAGCTETTDVDPTAAPDRDVGRLVLDLGLESFDAVSADGAADGEADVGAAADARPDGQAVDGSTDAGDAGEIDAAADDRQNER